MASHPSEIVEALGAFLAADSTITDLLATRTIGGVASKANSIFTGTINEPPALPCISLRFMGPRPRVLDVHENPHKISGFDLEVSIFGDQVAAWGIAAEVDERLEAGNIGATAISDPSHWAIKDIATQGEWTDIDIPRDIRHDNFGEHLVQLVKVYEVFACDNA